MFYPLPFYIVAFFLGAVIGSFLNVCICRLPKNQSVVFPSSHCPKCDYQISFYDNIPILSYIFLVGKCRSCKTHISLQYPLVELINGLLTLLLFLKFGISFTFLILFFFCSALVAVTFIDLKHQIIPDVISLSGIVVGFISSFYLPWLGWQTSLIGVLAGGGSLFLVAYGYQLLTGKEGMGGGDIKLLAMMGAFLGWRAVPFIIFIGALAGSLIGISIMLVQKKDSKLVIPFGPFLAFGALLYIFFGREIIRWYFSLGGTFGGST